MPPAPKEKKERGPLTEKSMRQKERLQRFENVDYFDRPWKTKRRRRGDPDGDAEEGEGL